MLFRSLLGPALVGIVIHFPAYRLGGLLSIRFSKTDEDVISTAKIISAMLLFPLTWVIVSVVMLELAGWPAALGTLLVLPFTGYAAIRFLEESDRFLGGLRALAFFLVRRRFFVRLLAERRAIKAEILALGEEASLAMKASYLTIHRTAWSTTALQLQTQNKEGQSRSGDCQPSDD